MPVRAAMFASGLAASPAVAASASRPDVIDREAAAEAYIARYPLVVSMRTFQNLGGLIGVNELFWQQALSGPETRTVVMPTATRFTRSPCSTCAPSRWRCTAGDHRPLPHVPVSRRLDGVVRLPRHQGDGREGRHVGDHATRLDR